MGKKLIYLFLFFLSVEFLPAQGLHDWQVITYMNNVTCLGYSNHEVWVGSSGGVYRYIPADSTWRTYTNLDGLKSLDLIAVAEDYFGDLLFACQDGIINLYNPNLNSWLAVFNLSGQKNVDICSDSITVWVASDEGVGVFESVDGELSFRDFYNNFTIKPEKAYRIKVFNNYIFYATMNGLFYATKYYTQENLKIATVWKNITTAQGLPSNVIYDLAVVDTNLYVATAAGAVWLDKSLTVHAENSWTNGSISRIITDQSRIYFVQNNTYYLKQDDQWILQQSLDKTISAGVIDDTGGLWFGLVNGGLRKQTWLKSFMIDGPASNHVGVVIRDHRGDLWMASGKFKLTFVEGFYKYDFKSWTNYKFEGDTWWQKNKTDCVYEDHLGRIWIGSWGGGATIITGDSIDYYHDWAGDGSLTISTLQQDQVIPLAEVPAEKRLCLSETRSFPTLTVLPYFKEDPNYNLWIVNHYANEPEYLAIFNNNNSVIPSCAEWTYLGGNIGMDLDDSQVSCLEFESSSSANRVWMGTWNRGILILDYGSDLESVSDDHLYRIDMNSDNLFSNTILSMKQDQDGIIWIGTSAGLNSYQNDASGLNRRVYRHVGEIGPVENKINAIYVDTYNNKWFATDGGLSVLQASKSPWDASAWVHYTTANSGLPSPVVNSVYVDNQTGAAYLGTELGLAIFKGSFSQFRSDLKTVKSGPNPFIVDGSKEFVIKNMVPGASVKIVNINGRLVRELTEVNGSITGSRAIWNGKDAYDKYVPSGIYLYLIFNEDGLKYTGKISVIKP